MRTSRQFVFMWSSQLMMPNYWATADALRSRIRIFSDAEIFQYFDGSIITAYMRESDLEGLKVFGRRFLKPSYFVAYRQQYLKERSSWWTWIRSIERKSYRRASAPELARDHEQYTTFFRDSIAYFGSTRTELTFAAEQRLEAILHWQFGPAWLEKFSILTTPIQTDEIQREQFDWQKIGKKPSDRALAKHASRYPWLAVGQFSEPAVLRYLRSRLRHRHHLSLRTFQQEKRELLKQQRELLRQIRSQRKEAEYLIHFMQTQAVERMRIKSYWAGSYYLSRNLWYALERYLNVPLNDIITFLTPEDIQPMLKGKEALDLKQRRKALVLWRKKGQHKINVYSGAEATRLFKKTVWTKTVSQEEVHGQTASLGKYRGRVRKVVPGDLDMLEASVKAFKQGEVLVTSMTQPNMMVLARRAGAIVADEGGITSHAAIISRELKVPCIVGCRHAMQVLNDGDMVEVDAGKGTVKKL